MNELDMLVNKNNEMMHEFSSRCIACIEGNGPLRFLLAPFYRILDANVEKEADKDRLIIECAVAAHQDGTDLRAVSLHDLFEKTRQVDAAFLQKVSLPPLLTDVRYQDFVDIRKKRIGVLFGTVCDLMKNWKEHHSFSETVRKTYSPEHFRNIIIDILKLYRLETMIVAASIKLPFPARKAKDRIEPKLFAIMELTAEGIAAEYTEKIFAVVETSCRDRS
jgi:hypothetical protein